MFGAVEEFVFASSPAVDRDGGGGASLRGGILSFIASKPFASSKDVILWFGENPAIAKTNQNELLLSP